MAVHGADNHFGRFIAAALRVLCRPTLGGPAAQTVRYPLRSPFRPHFSSVLPPLAPVIFALVVVAVGNSVKPDCPERGGQKRKMRCGTN